MRRKIVYTSAAGLIAIAILIFIFNAFFTTPPTCFDAKQNGNERGIDCGGSCSLLCQNQAGQPTAAWSRSFLTASSTYTAAAYVQNPNVGAAARNVKYSFQLFDADNHLIVERDGMMDLPPIGSIPVIESNINVGSRTPVRTLFAFSDLPVWNIVPENAIPRISITGQQLAQDGTRLSVTLVNDTVRDAKNITVVGVLFDASGVAVAASKSLVPILARKSTQAVVLTWPRSIQGVVRAEVTLLPSF